MPSSSHRPHLLERGRRLGVHALLVALIGSILSVAAAFAHGDHHAYHAYHAHRAHRAAHSFHRLQRVRTARIHVRAAPDRAHRFRAHHWAAAQRRAHRRALRFRAHRAHWLALRTRRRHAGYAVHLRRHRFRRAATTGSANSPAAALAATMSQSLRRGWLKVNGQGNVARYVATLATQTQGAASMSAAVASDVVTPAATTILHLPAPISQAGASASILAAAQAAVANSTRRFNFLPEHAPRRAHDAPGAALTRPATYRPAVSPAGAGATGGLSAAVQSVVSSAGGTTHTAPRAARPRPARAAKASATVPAASHQSTIQTVFVPVAKVLTEIPWWVYLALVTAMGCATSSTALAVRNGRRARRQAREIAAASAAAAAASAAAIHDPLTGLLNRRGFENAINRELARAQRHGRPFSIAYADVRGLKAVNDTQGHAAGDTLLKAVSNLLTDAARAGDTIARLGGDEFALLLPENTPHDAHAVTTRIAHAVTHTRTHLNLPHHWDLTIGTAAYPTDGHNADTLLATADRRLYEQRGIALAGTR